MDDIAPPDPAGPAGPADPGAARARLAALLDVELLVATPDPPTTPGACEVVEPEQLIVAMHTDDAGLALPAFTSPTAFLRWQPDGGQVARLAGRQVAELAAVDAEGRLAIDPGSPDALLVPVAEVVAVLAASPAGASPAAASTSYLVAAAAEPLPPEVAAAVRAALAASGVAASAHLVVIDDGTGSPGRCVAVRLAAGAEPAAVMPGVVDAVAAATEAAEGLDFVIAPPELQAAIEASGTDLLAP